MPMNYVRPKPNEIVIILRSEDLLHQPNWNRMAIFFDFRHTRNVSGIDRSTHLCDRHRLEGMETCLF